MAEPKYRVAWRWLKHPQRPIKYIDRPMTKEAAQAIADDLNQQYGEMLEHTVEECPPNR